MEGQLIGADVVGGQYPIGQGACMAVDGLEVRWARQGDRVRIDLRVGALAQPGQIRRGLGGAVVAEQVQPAEAAGGQGLGDGASTDLGALGCGAQIGTAEPTQEDAMQGGISTSQ